MPASYVTLPILAILFLLVTFGLGAAQNETVIYNIGRDGCPWGSLYENSAGMLFGTTWGNGQIRNPPHDSGTVFRLHESKETWRTTWDYHYSTYTENSPTGPLVADSSGNLYGTEFGDRGTGSVFEVVSSGTNPQYKDLYFFKGGSDDGSGPVGGVVRDSGGALYGTTYHSGAYGWGTVYRLALSHGNWEEKVLHSFGAGEDGEGPYDGGLFMDSSGDLFGTTLAGGTHGFGVVFELYRSSARWKEDVLYNFSGGNDGGSPVSGLIEDSSGDLYGTTLGGGANGLGTVFELTKPGAAWLETVLYSFDGTGGLFSRGRGIPR